jgi:hypothetical protein
MAEQFLLHGNFLSCTDDAKLHTSGLVNQHICITLANKLPREHLQHERYSFKVEVSCTLMYERIIGPVFFDEDFITSSSLLDILEK